MLYKCIHCGSNKLKLTKDKEYICESCGSIIDITLKNRGVGSYAKRNLWGIFTGIR